MNRNSQFLIFKFTSSSLVAHVQEAIMLHQVSFYQEMTRLAKKLEKLKCSSTNELLKRFRTISGSLRAALQKRVLD